MSRRTKQLRDADPERVKDLVDEEVEWVFANVDALSPTLTVEVSIGALRELVKRAQMRGAA